MSSAPRVTDPQRKSLAKKLTAALTAIYLARMQKELDKSYPGETAAVSGAAAAKIAAWAADRAQKVQTGVSKWIEISVNALPDGYTPEQFSQAVATARSEMADYNESVLEPYFASWSDHQGAVDTYDQHDALGDMLWSWDQLTSFEDSCSEAEAASPASLDELIAAAGGMAPVHENCQCVVTPHP